MRHRTGASCDAEIPPRVLYSSAHRTRHEAREAEHKEATTMNWTLIVNTFAGAAGAVSMAYLGWAIWICVRELPVGGRMPKGRAAKRRAPSGGRLRSRLV
jgi:hypothetical protein